MTKKYHVNPHTGNPGVCNAQFGNGPGIRGCPYGSLSEHFDSANEAREAYESSQEQIFGPKRTAGKDYVAAANALSSELSLSAYSKRFAPNVAIKLLELYRNTREIESFSKESEKLIDGLSPQMTRMLARKVYYSTRNIHLIDGYRIAERSNSIPGYGTVKYLLDEEGSVKAFVKQAANGKFVVIAEDAQNKKRISLPQDYFDSESDALSAFRHWSFNSPKITTQIPG